MALENIEWLDPLVDRERNRELEKYAKQVLGLVPPHAPYLAACPWILRADIHFDTAMAEIQDLADNIYLVVSRDNSCRWCYGASRLLMRLAGMSNAQIEKVEEDVELSRVEPRLRAGLEFARRVSRSNPAPDPASIQALRELGFSEAAIKELALFAAVVVFHNRFATLLALPVSTAERLAPFARLLRFLPLGKLNTLLRAQPRVTAAAPADDKGPFADLTMALGDLPHARVLRDTLDAAWASPILPARTRALIFAVIARGLENDSAEAEARRLLAEEGLESPLVVEDILANLASPELDARESRILPYVRETIWYQPAPVQRQGRALREVLTNAELLDTIGTAALANLVGRVSLALELT